MHLMRIEAVLSRMAMTVLIPLAVPAFVAGCATTGTNVESELICSKESDGCEVYEFVAAKEKALRSHGKSIELDCPWHFYCPTAESILPECKTLMEAALVLVNQRFEWELQAIKPSEIHYAEGRGYVDTFVPGQEAADCYTKITVTVPLKWREYPE